MIMMKNKEKQEIKTYNKIYDEVLDNILNGILEVKDNFKKTGKFSETFLFGAECAFDKVMDEISKRRIKHEDEEKDQ